MTTSHNLIDYGGLFVGRTDEIARIDHAIAEGARLITLFGPAGVGKTRLAVHYALTRGARLHHCVEAPTWFCDLAAVHTADDLLGAVMRAFGISNEAAGAGDPGVVVRNWIVARGRMLFILDNFEQAVDACAPLVARWAAQCPQAVFLLTSRHRLAIPAETVVAVDALAVPSSSESSPAAIASNDAVRLLLARVGVVPEAGGLPADHARMLADVVRRLEGNPLAIELAAARLELMTLPALRDRLSARFEVLRDPSRSPQDRHATLEAAIDGSWELLKPTEQAVLSQASVFEGGFTLDAAEAVIRVPVMPGAASVLDGIHGLARKSLLRSHRPGEPDFEPRFSMYTSVREYAAAKLRATGDEASVRARCQAYMLTATEGWCERVDGADGPEVLARLVAEHDNLRVVLRRALEVVPATVDSARDALRAAVAMGPALSFRGPVRTLIDVLDAALQAADTVPSVSASAWAARARIARGTAYRYAGNLDAAVTDLTFAAEISRRNGDHSLEAQAVRVTAVVMLLRGRLDESDALAAQALMAFERAGDKKRQGEALSTLGLVALERGDFGRARGLFEKALATLRAGDHLRFEGFVFGYLGTICTEQSDLERASAYYESALGIHQRFGNRRAEGATLGSIGIVRHQRGDLVGAAEAYGSALAIVREAGDARFEGYYLYYGAMLALERGDVAAAAPALESALTLLRAVGDPRYESIVLCARAAQRVLAGLDADVPAALEAARVVLAGVSDATLARLPEAVETLANVIAAVPGADDRARALIADLEALPSDDLRLMLRVVRSVLAGHEERQRTWTFGPGAVWFDTPEGGRVSLATRMVPARLLDALVAERLRAPGHALPLESLVSAGWPGTRVLKAAAVNRVHVALSMLRKAGLEPVLLRVRDGYLLDPAVPVRRGE